MRFFRALALGAGLMFLLGSGSGCMTAIKQAFREAKGAQGEVHPVETVHGGAFAQYNGVRFERAVSDVGSRVVPPGVLTSYDAAATEQVTNIKEFYPGGEPMLRITTALLYFQSKSALGGAEAMARVKIQDDSRMLVDAIVRSESDAFTAGGEAALARALAKAVGSFLVDKKFTPEAREAHDEAMAKKKEADSKSESDKEKSN